MQTEAREDVGKHYDAIESGYDRWTSWLDWAVLGRMRRELLASAHGDVLEIAIGTGKNLAYYGGDCRVTGLDLSSASLPRAARIAEKRGLVFEAHHGDAANMRFDAQRFDTVVCTIAGCTFDDPLAVYREMRRVLRPGGHALFLEHVRPKSRPLARFCRAIAPYSWERLRCDPNRDTERTIADAGLHVVKRHAVVGEMFVRLVAER
jgi:ubiquinone/menaquinone biosynthesis C-methylase UbiE